MTENEFEYVDLGLPSGTMWATCNVGANNPEDKGLLFQFGTVDGYKYVDLKNQFRAKDKNKKDTGSEYISVTTSGKVYKKNKILNLEDDAAHVNMGGKWRMPTKDELEELINNTTYDTAKVNGIKGMMFTSKINNNQLFMPFAGWWYNGAFMWAGTSGIIWSSQVDAYNINNAYRLGFNFGSQSSVYCDNRFCAFSVRGVFIK